MRVFDSSLQHGDAAEADPGRGEGGTGEAGGKNTIAMTLRHYADAMRRDGDGALPPDACGLLRGSDSGRGRSGCVVRLPMV